MDRLSKFEILYIDGLVLLFFNILINSLDVVGWRIVGSIVFFAFFIISATFLDKMED